MQLLQIGNLKGCEGLECEIVERWPSPEREGLPKLRDALFSPGGTTFSNPSVEPAKVELVIGDVEDVPAMPREQDIWADQLAQLGNVVRSAARAVRGASSAQSPSMILSVDRTSPGRSRRITSSARCLERRTSMSRRRSQISAIRGCGIPAQAGCSTAALPREPVAFRPGRQGKRFRVTAALGGLGNVGLEK